MRPLDHVLTFALIASLVTVACNKEQPQAAADATLVESPSTEPTASALSAEPPPEEEPTASASASPPPAPSSVPLSACDNPGHTKCFDTKYALYCRNGKYEILPCKGPGGCRSTGGPNGDAVCDDNIAAEGDQCLAVTSGKPGANYACTPDHKTQLVCRGGKFVKSHACRGPRGCSAWGGKVDCDSSIAEPGDACESGTSACKADKSALLECKGGRFAITNTCRGPKACTVHASNRRVDCDDSVGNVGDPCDTPNELRCSVDKKHEIVCTGGKYAKKRSCPKRGCSFKGTETNCE